MSSRSTTRQGRGSWIAAGMEALMDRGAQAVSVEALARELGVTKGSFYWHFKQRAELLEAILETWEREGTQRIIEAVEEESGEALDRLQRLVSMTTRPTSYDELELALRDWARTDRTAAAAVQRVDRRRLRYVTDLLVEIGLERPRARLRAHIFYRTLIGEFVFRSSGGSALSRRALDEVLSFLSSTR